MKLSELLEAMKMEQMFLDLKHSMKMEGMHLKAKTENPGQVLTPCGIRETLLDSFEMFGDKLAFWFNVDKDTKCILED